MTSTDAVREGGAVPSGHTPGPWDWGRGWAVVEGTGHGVEGEGPKYADIALCSRERVILPLAVDHYNIIWDDRKRDSLTAADRALIAAAPDLLDALIALRDAVKASGKMNGMEYDGLGIQVNAAIRKARAQMNDASPTNSEVGKPLLPPHERE